MMIHTLDHLSSHLNKKTGQGQTHIFVYFIVNTIIAADDIVTTADFS